jgi:nucleoside-diphosphate-sugar epimerase
MASSVPKTVAASSIARRILVFGCGYLGSRVAAAAVDSGDEVWASTRDVAKGESLRKLGVEPIVADWTDRRTLTDLPEVERVLISVSHDPRSKVDRFASQVCGLANLLHVLPPECSICYISTTGVYHQANGCWVDERSPTRPTRAGARMHLMGENLLHRLRPRSRWTILRLAGIYGPGRIPRIADVRAGLPIAASPDSYLNLIRVEDAAEAVLACWSRSTERLYVVADDCPVLRRDYYRFIADACGAPEPTFRAPGEGKDGAQRIRSDSNKRVWNRRMKRDLLPRLRYPSYREGLSELL